MAAQHEELFEVQRRTPQPTVGVRTFVPLDGLSEAQGEALRELWAYFQDRGSSPEGPPFVRYHTFGEDGTDVEIGVPVAEPAQDAGPVVAAELPGGTAVATWHLGPHDNLADTYALLAAWMEEHGRKPDGGAWEVYHWIDLTRRPDPAAWPAPSTWRTHLVQPID